MNPDDRKSAVDAPTRATAATHRDAAGLGLPGAGSSGLAGSVSAGYGVRTPWRWAAGTIVLLAAAAELAWFFGRSGEPEAERRRLVEQMSRTEQAALAAKFDRFQKLDPPERDRLRNLHAAIESAPDPDALRTTLEQYESWVAQLSPQLSAELVGLPTDRRVAKVASLVAEQHDSAAKVFGEADSKVLVGWLEKQVRKHHDEMLSHLPQMMRDRLEHMGDRERTWSLMFFALSQRAPGGWPLKLSPVELADLRGSLSPKAQAQWNAAAGNPDEFKMLLAGWVRQSMERTMAQAGPATRVTDKELLEFFDRELSEDERNRLVALPREEMMSQLRREYFRRKGLWREGYWRADGRRPGDGGMSGPNDGGAGEGRMGDGKPGDGRFGEGRPGGMGGPRPFGRGPGGFGPRTGGGFGPGGNNPGGNPGNNPPNPDPDGGPPRPRQDNGPTPPPPKAQA